jgi:crossover junction endodeoxyribonuclease RusA
MARNGKSDLDNRVKPLLDALTAAEVWQDDSLIDELHIVRAPVKAPGWVDVTIETIA